MKQAVFLQLSVRISPKVLSNYRRLGKTGNITLDSKPERRAENQRRGRRVDSQVGIFQLCGYPSNAIVATPKAISAAPAIRVFDLCSFNKKMPTSAPRTTLTSRVAPA